MTVCKEDIEDALGPCDDARRVGSPSGMGECWRVEQGGEVVACKVVLQPGENERFEREVAALARLDSARVVAVRGHGSMRLRSDGKDRKYLLSDFIEGGDALVNARSALPDEPQLRAFLAGVLDGLIDLHGAAVIHRDIKPENVILRGSDWTDPVLIDLGLSRLPDLTSMTRYPWAGGTWPFMAPEQLAGERATPRSDVWALAVVASLLALGRHPLRADGEETLPADWDARLLNGVPMTSKYAGLDAWLSATGQRAGYRRPDAAGARKLLDQVWS